MFSLKDVKFTFFDELDLAFSKVLKLLDTPLFIFLLHMLLTVVITSIVLYLLMTVVSSFNIYMTARAFYQSPHTSWTLIGRYLTCMDTGLTTTTTITQTNHNRN